MGMILIQTDGSFGPTSETFSAMRNGHADAVARAIEYMAAKMLPAAIARDHELHEKKEYPVEGFKRQR